MMSRAAALIRSFAQAESKSAWFKRKISNRLARRKIEQAWREFAERLPHEQLVNEAFDQRHGTDTAEEIGLLDTGVPAEDAARGRNIYRPVWEREFHAVMAALRINLEGFTFVDIGSGKGKMLMMAADYPFARIVGVEYSPGLHAICERNLALYHAPGQRCTKLEAVLGDALSFQLPDGPIVCMIFNALDADTMNRFMRHIEDDLALRPSPAFVIYSNLRHVAEIDHGLDGIRRLKLLKKTAKLIVFGNKAAAESFHRA